MPFDATSPSTTADNFGERRDDQQVKRYSGDVRQDLDRVLDDGAAAKIVGGLSHPSKMPEAAWGISAFRCQVGSILADQDDTTCSHCYARKGRYRFARVESKNELRLQGLSHPLWVPAMVLLIRWNVSRYFRWFDSGDLQNENHLFNITKVAESTPHILHWLPTQEHRIVRDFQEPIPENLLIRLSSRLVDGERPEWSHTSGVFTERVPRGSTECEAPSRGNRCGPCRACWDPDIQDISYRLK